MTSTADFKKAADVLQEGSASRSGNPQLSEDVTPTQGALEWLDELINLGEVVPDIIGGLSAWIIAQLPPFQEAIDELAGDAEALHQLARSWESIATGLDDHASEMDAISAPTQEAWEGAAASNFAAHMAAESACARAAAGAWRTMASRALQTGEYVGNARKAVVSSAGMLLDDIIEAALKIAQHAIDPRKWGTLIQEFKQSANNVISETLTDIAHMMQDVLAQGSELLGQMGGIGDEFARAATILRTGADPEDPEGAGAQVQGAAQVERDRDLAALNGLDDGEAPPEGYEEVSAESVGIDPSLLKNDETGFEAKLYRGKDGSLVVVYKGTEAEMADVAEDAAGVGQLTGQSADAVALAQALDETEHAPDVIYTGHSLGGRLASTASMATGNGAVTFNAAGVPPATVDYFAARNGVDPTEFRQQIQDGQVRLYTTEDDILTKVQEDSVLADGAPDAVGRQYRLPGSKDPISGHLMDNVEEQFDAHIGATGGDFGEGDTSPNPEYDRS